MDQSEIIDQDMLSDLRVRERAPVTVPPNWYAVYVKSRHEFMVWNELLRKGIESFLPSVKKISQWKDRKKLVEYPLFPGYVFVRVPHQSCVFLEVLKTRGVVTFISLEPGFPTPIALEEVASLRLLVESGRDVDVFPGLKQGTKVRIKNGPLKNAEGILIRKENEYIFQVNVELLGRSVAIKITPHDIEAA